MSLTVSPDLLSFSFQDKSSLILKQFHCFRHVDRFSFGGFRTFWPKQLNKIQSTSTRSISKCALDNFVSQTMVSEYTEPETNKSFDGFMDVANKLADAAAEITLKYFRTPIDILEKLDKSPVTVADQAAEKAMRSIIKQHYPSHAIFGEEGGLTLPEHAADHIWVLDPIDGTKSYITGKPVFGTLIALVHKGTPILGLIDQPVMKERWIGRRGQRTTLNGKELKTRACASISSAYMYTTSPHLFQGQSEIMYERLRKKVKVPLYGCDCYAYGLLAAGHIDLVVEAGLKPYDYLALVPVVEGSGGIITDWQGQSIKWWPSMNNAEMTEDIIAAGAIDVHKDVLEIISES